MSSERSSNFSHLEAHDEQLVLRRIAAQTKANIVVDRDALDDPDLLCKTQGGGFNRLNKLFDGQLKPTLEAFNDALWPRPDAPAA